MPRVAVPSRRSRARPPWEAFSGDGGAPPPGPELAALLGEAVAALDQLDERQLLGAGSAARRLQAYAEYLEIMAVAEFARRRAEQFEASKARGDRVRSRDGEYPAEELGFEMTATAYSAALLHRHGAEHRRPAAVHPGGDGGGQDRPGPRPRHQQRHPPPARRAGRRSPTRSSRRPRRRYGSRTCSRRPPGSRPALTPRACRRARTRRGMTGGSSCAARTPVRRRWPAGSLTRPRQWRGRRRSTPRRSGSATPACPAPWPRSGR